MCQTEFVDIFFVQFDLLKISTENRMHMVICAIKIRDPNKYLDVENVGHQRLGSITMIMMTHKCSEIMPKYSGDM